MRAHCLQHIPFETFGSIKPWLLRAGYEISCTRLYASEAFPDIDDINFLVVLGGPMSVNDEDLYPWLKEEKAFIRRVMQKNTPVLGICLGAQLIASSLGAEVFPNEKKEIGWYPVQGVKNKGDGSFQFPDSVEVFHWHGETFSLPVDSVLLAESRGCRNQAFQIGNKVMGLQFHLETTPDSARSLVENCRDELVEAEYVQTEDRILSEPSEHYAAINGLMGRVLKYLTQTE